MGSVDHSLKRLWPFEDERSTTASGTSTPAGPQQRSEMLEPVETQTTCFGSIVDAKAQMRSSSHRVPNGSVKAFSLTQEGDYFTLEYGGHHFARLSKGLCSTFRAISITQQVHFRAFVQEKDWNVAEAPPTNFALELNVYGPKDKADEVGKILSKQHQFLQKPRYEMEGVEYYNPQLLRLNGHLEPVANEFVDLSREGLAQMASSRVEDQPNVPESTAVDSILDSLSHNVSLRSIPVDGRIKSVLLPHQKEAIDFIFQREIGTVPSELSLWRYNEIDADEPFYHHVFSGAKCPKQDETKGGIIADEMGLGKSLVVLSTVAGTLDRSENFAAQEHQALRKQSSRRIPSKATLILAPSSLLIDSWVEEIRKHTHPGGLSFHKHLGPSRHAETALLRERMIVFTTYATVATEYCRGDSPLAKIDWFRIVLDEAHDIRNRLTKQFQAVTSLSAQHRWCLTGTPIQNTLEDLGALVSFLKVPIMEKAPTFRKFIMNPISSGSTSEPRFRKLRTLLQTICLRRTRDLLKLGEPIEQTRRISFTPSEQADYDSLFQQCREEIDRVVCGRGGKKGNTNSTMLESLLRLRLFCNNGTSEAVLQKDAKGVPADPDELLTYLQQHDQNVCTYCSGVIYSINDSSKTDGGIFLSSCCHLVCRNCLPHHRAQKDGCPSCATDGSVPMLAEASSNDEFQLEGMCEPHWTEHYPSKLLRLLSDLREDPTHKSIVFSSWKKTLGVVGRLLDIHGIRFDIIDGTLSLPKRIKVLKDFRSPDGANILLMTLGTGAVGLNLAIASRVYLLEPQWNPHIESQAIGRVLRLGQTAQVVIIRYIMRNTIEESNVLSKQEKKRQLAGGGFRNGKTVQPEKLHALLNVFHVHSASKLRDA
ncbi:hypothetical protein BU16DRAFT_620011 [Lophium mytilinum]|uniref:Uncharacterized protein n=1 Tax=Lophium mytilinum TaxID=390894 RepID=A0A6A6QK98_9PEZI|nr:hypothetical protein BU16DRAFT_620011 [Lophium mytilinum]